LKVLPDTTYDAIVQLRADELTYNAIAKGLDIDIQTVRRALKRYKATGDPKPKPQRLSALREAEVIALYQAGATKTHTAQILGISPGTVASVLDRTGTCAIVSRAHKGKTHHRSNEGHCRLCTILLTPFDTKEDSDATYCMWCKQAYPGWVNTGMTAKQVQELMYGA